MTDDLRAQAADLEVRPYHLTPKACAVAVACAHYHAELDAAALPRIDRPQLVKRDGRTVTFALMADNPRGRRRAGRPPIVGSYRPDDRTLTKPVDPEEHYYRRLDGYGWNLELLTTADRWRPRPRRLEVVHGHRDPKPRPSWVPWRIVRRYAVAAAQHHPGVRLDDDVDPQALIPWEAWAGLAVGPDLPPAPSDPPAGEADAPQPSLL